MKYLLISFIGFVMFTSCDTATKEQSNEVSTELAKEDTKPEPSQAELEASTKNLIAQLLDFSTLNVQKNGSEKWVVSEDVFTKLMKVKQQIYVISGNMENYEVSSYNEMGEEFLDFVKTIPELEDTAANTELQKVVNATNQQCAFLLESNLQNAQLAVINMSIIYDEVPNYFTVNK